MAACQQCDLSLFHDHNLTIGSTLNCIHVTTVTYEYVGLRIHNIHHSEQKITEVSSRDVSRDLNQSAGSELH